MDAEIPASTQTSSSTSESPSDLPITDMRGLAALPPMGFLHSLKPVRWLRPDIFTLPPGKSSTPS